MREMRGGMDEGFEMGWETGRRGRGGLEEGSLERRRGLGRGGRAAEGSPGVVTVEGTSPPLPSDSMAASSMKRDLGRGEGGGEGGGESGKRRTRRTGSSGAMKMRRFARERV